MLREGAIDGVLVTFRDITQRRLDAERHRLQSAALQAAANGIVITDRQGEILWVNESFCALTGYAEAELLGQHTRMLRSGLQDPGVYQELWKQILSGHPWRGEWVNLRRDGSSYSEEVTITPVLDERGEITHFIGIKQDITERSRTEAALQQSSEQLSLAIEGAGVGLWDWNMASDEMFFNERWAAVIGYTLDELGPLNSGVWRGLLHPDDIGMLDLALQSHFAGETPAFRLEARLIHKDGHEVWTVTRGKVAQWDAQGRPLRMAGTQLDISTRKRAEQTLRESHAALEGTNRQLVQAIERANQLAACLDMEQGILQVGGSRELYLDLLQRFAVEYSAKPQALEAEIGSGEPARGMTAASLSLWKRGRGEGEFGQPEETLDDRPESHPIAAAPHCGWQTWPLI